MAAEAEPEAGVVAVADPGVGHVYQVTVDREAVGQHAAGGNDTAGHEAEGAIGMDPQHRDLVAARDQAAAAWPAPDSGGLPAPFGPSNPSTVPGWRSPHTR